MRSSPGGAVLVGAPAGEICCVPRQDNQLSQCHSLPKCINGYWGN